MQGGGGVSEEMLTTKGDTHGYTTENARVPIGVNSTVLTADSTTALGLAWTAPAAGYTQPTLGTTVIPSNTTVTTLDGLTLTDLTVPPVILKSQGISGLGGLTFTPTAINSVGHLLVTPSTGNTRSQMTFTRQPDPTVDADLLTIGSDVYGTSENTIRTYSSGTGTTRDLRFMYDNTERMKMVSGGIDITGVLNVNGSPLAATPIWKIVAYG